MFATTYLLTTGDQLRLRGISFGCDAARPAARRRVGEPAASAERERRGRQRRCLQTVEKYGKV